MKILLVRTWPTLLDVGKQTYNIQEVGLAKALMRPGTSGRPTFLDERRGEGCSCAGD